MNERISRILELWYLDEPALFQVLCSHDMLENPKMDCAVRCGRRRIEYNPDFIREMSDGALTEALKTEAIRILLKHPYERRPDQCSGEAIALGSNVCIGDQYTYGNFRIEKPSDFSLESGRPFEWYARKIQELLPPGEEPGEGNFPFGGMGAGHEQSQTQGQGQGQNNGEGQGQKSDSQREGQAPGSNGFGQDDRNDSQMSGTQEKATENRNRNLALSELWEEDEMAVAMINGIIESTTKWGCLSGSFAEMLKASTKAKINWKTVFAGFRASILSSKRKLTRMRPNRRSGFAQMGSIRRFDTKLLVAVDVSGSISSSALSYFYGVINSAFKYGFESIDVVQFDCGITQVQSLKKTMKDVTAIGRGGTSFQEPIDYAAEHDYDGLIILTDGYAPSPTLPDSMRCKIIWVCQDKQCYDAHHSWMEKLGRVCTMEIH